MAVCTVSQIVLCCDDDALLSEIWKHLRTLDERTLSTTTARDVRIQLQPRFVESMRERKELHIAILYYTAATATMCTFHTCIRIDLDHARDARYGCISSIGTVGQCAMALFRHHGCIAV